MSFPVDLTRYRSCELCRKPLQGQCYYTLTATAVAGPYAPEDPITLITGTKPICEACVWAKEEPRRLVIAELVAARGPILAGYRDLYQRWPDQAGYTFDDGLDPRRLTAADEPPSPVRTVELLADVIKAAVWAIEAGDE